MSLVIGSESSQCPQTGRAENLLPGLHKLVVLDRGDQRRLWLSQLGKCYEHLMGKGGEAAKLQSQSPGINPHLTLNVHTAEVERLF